MDISFIIVIILVSLYFLGVILYFINNLRIGLNQSLYLTVLDSFLWPGDIINYFFCITTSRPRSNAQENLDF